MSIVIVLFIAMLLAGTVGYSHRLDHAATPYLGMFGIVVVFVLALWLLGVIGAAG